MILKCEKFGGFRIFAYLCNKSKKENRMTYTEVAENRVVVKNGKVELDISSERIELEEARELLHDMIRKEYALS